MSSPVIFTKPSCSHTPHPETKSTTISRPVRFLVDHTNPSSELCFFVVTFNFVFLVLILVIFLMRVVDTRFGVRSATTFTTYKTEPSTIKIRAYAPGELLTAYDARILAEEHKEAKHKEAKHIIVCMSDHRGYNQSCHKFKQHAYLVISLRASCIILLS